MSGRGKGGRGLGKPGDSEVFEENQSDCDAGSKEDNASESDHADSGSDHSDNDNGSSSDEDNGPGSDHADRPGSPVNSENSSGRDDEQQHTNGASAGDMQMHELNSIPEGDEEVQKSPEPTGGDTETEDDEDDRNAIGAEKIQPDNAVEINAPSESEDPITSAMNMITRVSDEELPALVEHMRQFFSKKSKGAHRNSKGAPKKSKKARRNVTLTNATAKWHNGARKTKKLRRQILVSILGTDFKERIENALREYSVKKLHAKAFTEFLYNQVKADHTVSKTKLLTYKDIIVHEARSIRTNSKHKPEQTSETEPKVSVELPPGDPA